MSRRIATALLVTRGHGDDLEVYLAERAPELRFFGGYLALPGGTLTPEDIEATSSEPEAMQHCAHRELFEELGLLRHEVDAEKAAPKALAAVRRLLLERERAKEPITGPEPFGELVKNARPPDPPRLLCRVETPPFAPVRFDTEFFHVPLEQSAAGTSGHPPEPDVWQGELTGGGFWRAADAIAAWRRGEILLVPPVVIMLEHLAAATDFESFCGDVSKTTEEYRKGRLHQVRFTPGVVLAPLRTETLPPATTTNCYIVGRDELWVVDPGSPFEEEQRRLLRLLDELCAGGARVRGILATHHHPDHVGGMAALSQALDLEVRGHALTLERLPPGCRIGAPLADGDRIALGAAPDGTEDWSLICSHTPGHDRGHLCFAESRYDAVLVGDMLSTVSTIIIDPPEGHLQTYLKSLQSLLDAPMSTLYPAHGPAMRDGHRLVAQYIRHRRHREASLLQHLQQASTIEELLPLVYWDADERLYPFAARSLLAGLQKLVEEGRVVQGGADWRLTS
jgi:ribonuclease/clavin/mitogillin